MIIGFFEIYLSGHRYEHISHLMVYLQSNPTDDRSVFILHPDFVLPLAVQELVGNEELRFEIIRFTSAEQQALQSGNILSRSINIFGLADGYARKYEVDHLHFLTLNDVQFALGMHRTRYTVSGLQFKPFVRQQRKSVSQRINWLRKYYQTWFYARKKSVKSVFLLNDQSSASYLNSTFHTTKFRMIPDPVPDWLPEPGFSVRDYFKIPPGRKLLLHIGSLMKSKGTLDILDAFEYIPDSELAKFSLLLAGKPVAGMESQITDCLAAIRRKSPEASVIYHNEFVSNSILKSFFEQCDAVLAPYHDAESSSGIVGHAIAFSKPVLVVKGGLPAEMASEQSLGFLIDSLSAEEVARGIGGMLTTKFTAKSPAEYLAFYNKKNYSRMIIDAITESR
jgi:glycosyltransferase involved in cell wall biosynthesis